MKNTLILLLFVLITLPALGQGIKFVPVRTSPPVVPTGTPIDQTFQPGSNNPVSSTAILRALDSLKALILEQARPHLAAQDQVNMLWPPITEDQQMVSLSKYRNDQMDKRRWQMNTFYRRYQTDSLNATHWSNFQIDSVLSTRLAGYYTKSQTDQTFLKLTDLQTAMAQAGYSRMYSQTVSQTTPLILLGGAFSFTATVPGVAKGNPVFVMAPDDLVTIASATLTGKATTANTVLVNLTTGVQIAAGTRNYTLIYFKP